MASRVKSVKSVRQSIKSNDVKALVRLSDDMQKCHTVLLQLKFTSNLDASGTLESIFQRLRDNFWVKRIEKASRILGSGREPTFQDLASFVKDKANIFRCQFGISYAERKAAANKSSGRGDKQVKLKKSKKFS